jgi:hypothetical protein
MNATAEISGDRLRIAPEEWLDLLRREYLTDYIPSGGASVKVVSGSQDSLRAVRRSLHEMATEGNYFHANLDPAQPDPAGKRPDLHRIDKFFFAATRAVNWKAWAAVQAREYLESHGIRVRPDRELSDLEGIAADNGRLPQDLLHQYQTEFATRLLKDHRMTVEFRAAVTALGRAQLVPDAVTPTTEEVLLEWFAGRTMPGAAATLKKVQIFERVHQMNARHILASFCHWLPDTGHSGLLVTLDFRPYEHKKITKTQRQAEENRRLREAIARGASAAELAALVATEDDTPAITYSDAAYIQMLTLIRRFIDEIDRFERFLLVIFTTPQFYDAASRRNYNDYDALQTRIGLEVHDARRANPAAALVHLGGPHEP